MTPKRHSSPRRKPTRRLPVVHQFLIVLTGTDPLVWRRIQVPDGYSFWDLHVAIQDAMGWLDYHLHEFTVVHPDTNRAQRIGMPDSEDMDDRPLLRDSEVPIADHFRDGGPPALYVYDFGDDWQHVVAYEAAAASLIERGLRTGSPFPRPGAPLLADFSVMELSALLGRSLDSGRNYVGQVI